jgi:ATP-dependent DNA helicase RecQ
VTTQQTAHADSAPPDGVAELRRVARERFGISRLHPEQEQAISSILAGRDTLLIMPTGGGKSLCYQLPSLLLPRPTVVVSPLLALLEDQYLKLQQLGIPSVRLDSTVGVADRRAALATVAKGGSVLVLTTPETLAGAELGGLLEKIPPSLVAVDEAHCISEWGHDFRPAYLALGQRLQEFKGGHILGLTATATPPVRDDIVRYLALREPEIIVASPHRQNLVFEVRRARGDDKLRQLAKLAKRLPRPGIIYCSTTKAVEDVWLGLRLIKVPCARYHGKMTDKDRTQHQARFMRKGKRIVMVATSAFGLGIDKPDIRYIVHYQAPASLERYVQEAGRAGRDGHLARCILLFDESDLEIQEHLLSLSRLSPSLLGRFGRAFAAWAEEDRDPTIEELALSAGISQRAATSLVTTLVEAGVCERVAGGKVHATVPHEELGDQVDALRSRFEVLRREDARRLQALVDYANEGECRSVALRRYFGDEDAAPCGRCDLCRLHGVAEPGRTGRRRRRARGRRPMGGRPDGRPPDGRSPDGRPDGRSDGNGAFPGNVPGQGRKRRRRRRGRRGPHEDGVAARPLPAPPPPAVVPFELPPLDPEADDLAAELGAPGLPPAPGQAAAADAPKPRRRRRRRGPTTRRGRGNPNAEIDTPQA